MPEGSENVAVNSVIAVLTAEGESAADIDLFTSSSAAVSEPAVSVDASEENSSSNSTAPATVAASAAVSNDFPEGATIRSMTVREALRDAMAEEMRKDGNVYVMGEEVAEYNGAYKITPRVVR